ncbi:MAG: hypothetical protein H0V44_06615 [Planctomycetes bacterium]|nr:hypothetical protein [Planctomycetota bacterium]
MRLSRTLPLVAIAAAVVLSTGCAAARSPVTGAWYTQIKANDSVTTNSASSKVGRSTANSYVGLVALGDCSIATAAANGGITKVSHVDYETMSILGLYATTTTVVYGE